MEKGQTPASSARFFRDSSHVCLLAQREERELVFIDAHHCHPNPLLDLLLVAPFMRGGGWIIRLGSIGTDSPFGAEWLFQRSFEVDAARARRLRSALLEALADLA